MSQLTLHYENVTNDVALWQVTLHIDNVRHIMEIVNHGQPW